MDRPLTVREIQDNKRRKREAEQNKIKIRNITRMQMVPLQLYGKNSKDAINQITVMVGPGKSVDLPEYRLIKGQIDNLRKKKSISTTRVGSGGREFSSVDYKQFLPGSRKKIDVSRSSKKQSNKKSSSKARAKVTKL